MTLEEIYLSACQDSQIGAHLPRLCELAKQCEHVTEFGTRDGHSTAALLYAKPQTLVAYDVNDCPAALPLMKLSKYIRFEFRRANVWLDSCSIEPTDMLFTDTVHEYRYLKRELELHAGKVRKFIAIHDTEAAGPYGGGPAMGGLQYAIEEFLWNDAWEQIAHYPDSCGLTVLARKSDA